jgi:hypothetical protein
MFIENFEKPKTSVDSLYYRRYNHPLDYFKLIIQKIVS